MYVVRNMDDKVRFAVTLSAITIAIIVIGSVLEYAFNPAESKKILCVEMKGYINWFSIFNIRTAGLKTDYNQQCFLVKEGG